MKSFRYLFLAFFLSNVVAQTNISLMSRIDYQQLHGANLNDVWGYVDETGKEYAIVGTSKGTSILDISDPTQPNEVFWVAGSESIWRDPSVHGDYAYVTTEAEDGLTIIDLSPLPGSTMLPIYTYFGNSTPQLLSAHTCFIDENGFAYLFGSNLGNGGVRILDVHSDPINPIEVGFFDDWYVHDGFVRNDTMFLAHIIDGFFSLVDVADKTNPVLLGKCNTPNNFTHNIWPTNDGQTVYTTDEVSGAYITAYDISDPLNIREIDRYQNSSGSGVIPHNTHVRGDYLITSYYSDGVIVNDITYPDNIVKVAEFDTYPTQTSGFDGNWGVYPFFPSGNIVASDITEGLFVLGVNYQKASYLEGLITDASTTLPLSGVQIQINTNEHIEGSRSDGTYKTGILGSGTYNITYSKVGYYPQMIDVALTQGVVTIKNVQLIPIPPYNLTVNVYESGTSIPVPEAKISFRAPLIEHTGVTNGLGQENLTLYYEVNYDVTVGKWGYFPFCYEQEINASTGILNIYLEKGYNDDFSFDFGWQVSGTATTGVWERGKPFATSTGSAPVTDADFDCNEIAYITGNAPVFNPDMDDVDGGVTVLTSPTMDLSAYTDPHINFNYWLYCKHGHPPDDTLKVTVSNGITSVVLVKLPPYDSLFYRWNSQSIRLLDHITPTSSMNVSFYISDNDPIVNITEAGIDYFTITNSSVLGQKELIDNYSIYPNPFTDYILVESENEVYKLYELNGKLLKTGKISAEKMLINLSDLSRGAYLLQLGSKTTIVIKE